MLAASVVGEAGRRVGLDIPGEREVEEVVCVSEWLPTGLDGIKGREKRMKIRKCARS